MAEHKAENTESGRTVPTPQGLVLFEVYEANGALLLVTSDATLIEVEAGDYVVRRPWATAGGYEEVRRG